MIAHEIFDCSNSATETIENGTLKTPERRQCSKLTLQVLE